MSASWLLASFGHDHWSIQEFYGKVPNALDSVGFAQDLSSIIYHHLSSLSPLKCRSYMLANSRTHNRNMSWLSCFKHISSCLSPSSGHQKAQQKTPRIPLWDESMTTPCNRTWRCGWGEDDGWGGVRCNSDFEILMTDIWYIYILVGGFKHFYFPCIIIIWDVIQTPLTNSIIFQDG